MLITSNNIETIRGYTYKTFEAVYNNKTVSVMQVTGNSNYVVVMYKNAAHKAYRGMGKQFSTIQEALNNYKDASIKAIIEASITL